MAWVKILFNHNLISSPILAQKGLCHFLLSFQKQRALYNQKDKRLNRPFTQQYFI